MLADVFMGDIAESSKIDDMICLLVCSRPDHVFSTDPVSVSVFPFL